MKLLGEITVAVSVRGEVFRVPGFQIKIKYIWRHALASGIFGKEIARLKRVNVEGQFLCGLLHTIGKPVALHALVDLQKKRLTSLPPESVLDLMEEFHCLIGKKIADYWKLPLQVQHSAVWYQNYAEAPACHPAS